jgi:hypothetical protein
VVNRCVDKGRTISSIYDYVRSLRERAPAGMPVGAYIEVADPIDALSCGPLTQVDVRDEIHEAIAAGATVLNPWTWSDASGTAEPYDRVAVGDRAAAFKAGVVEAHAYDRAVLAPPVPGGFPSVDGDTLKIGERVIRVGTTSTYYVIAVNGTSGTLSWSGKLAGLNREKLTSLIDGSTLRGAAGRVTVRLPRDSWQIYTYEAGTPSKG